MKTSKVINPLRTWFYCNSQQSNLIVSAFRLYSENSFRILHINSQLKGRRVNKTTDKKKKSWRCLLYALLFPYLSMQKQQVFLHTACLPPAKSWLLNTKEMSKRKGTTTFVCTRPSFTKWSKQNTEPVVKAFPAQSDMSIKRILHK